ncbi:MAG: hypothetical protein GY821_10085 [Gammaproteobacteria bacterium]|nr:hypothetical protein [Gammaproteobacteria bacterium]
MKKGKQQKRKMKTAQVTIAKMKIPRVEEANEQNEPKELLAEMAKNSAKGSPLVDCYSVSRHEI